MTNFLSTVTLFFFVRILNENIRRQVLRPDFFRNTASNSSVVVFFFQCDTLLFWVSAACSPPDACLITLIFVLTTNFQCGTLLKLFSEDKSSAMFSVSSLEDDNQTEG